jgi:IrrE N-terminal-like domain
MTPNEKNDRADIRETVRQVYEVAEIDFDRLLPGISPLGKLLAPFGLPVLELPDNRQKLTFRSAIEYLRQETGTNWLIPEGEENELSGFLFACENAGIYHGYIFTESSDSTARRRFSAAHELGHYLLHFLPMIKAGEAFDNDEMLIWTEGLSQAKDETNAPAKIATSKADSPKYVWLNEREKERQANQFAAELLMPAHICYELFEKHSRRSRATSAAIARQMATDMLVSFEAMKWRLNDLGLQAPGERTTEGV